MFMAAVCIEPVVNIGQCNVFNALVVRASLHVLVFRDHSQIFINIFQIVPTVCEEKGLPSTVTPCSGKLLIILSVTNSLAGMSVPDLSYSFDADLKSPPSSNR